MLLDQVVFNFNEVGEKSVLDIKNECLCHFAYRLKDLLEADNGDSTWGIWNYKTFQGNFGSKIKYNSKNIVYEETLYNDEPWSVKDTCKECYGLEWVEGSENQSGYYRYPNHTVPRRYHPNICTESVKSKEYKSEIAEENIRRFSEYFGLGEFPFITITMIRLGNKDHYFYRIHR